MTDSPEQQGGEVPAGLSLRDRIAARERELEAKQAELRSFRIPLPGKADFLAVRYRPLSFQEEVRLEKRHEKMVEENPAEGYALAAADKLVNACERICERNGADWRDTEYKLDARAARELFGRDLPDDATGRVAVRAIFGDDETMVEHAAKYEQLRKLAREVIDSQLEGE